LRALRLAPREIDELRLAQILLSLPPDPAGRTCEKSIHRLPPAHALTVTPRTLQLRRYWYLEQVPELRLPSREEYVEAFRQVFDEAVRCRLPGDHDPGVTLSGGLDSGSVTATAAAYLRQQGKRLRAFTSVPRSDTTPYTGTNFGDEFPLARATAAHAGNVDLVPVAAENASVLGSIREVLFLLGEPAHSACNCYWIQDLLRRARSAGCGTLLTGQFGNGGISWAGYVSSQPWRTQWRLLGWRGWGKERIKRWMPGALLATGRRLRRYRPGGPWGAWYKQSAIHPAFARRLGLFDPYVYCPNLLKLPAAPREQRYRILQPGRSPVGAIWAEKTRAAGLEIWDPTADVRVLEFTLGVPDHVFVDPASGLDRWLIREAMANRLPDEVRLNRRRGQQGGDLLPRLRAEAGEWDEALDQFGRGPAGEYVDVHALRDAWRVIRAQDTPEAWSQAVVILTRGIMAGLFVHHFGRET
jgi:asparagine synthase (glutamine-hydrolysing)